MGNHLLAVGQGGGGWVGQHIPPLEGGTDGHVGDIHDVTAVYRHRPRHGVQTRASARLAWLFRHVLFDLVAHIIGGCFAVAALQIVDNPLEFGAVDALRALAVYIFHGHFLATAVQHNFLLCLI